MEEKILNVVRMKQPIKARAIATILNREFNLNVERSDVNSVLYRLKQLEKNSSHEWSFVGEARRNSTKTKSSKPTGTSAPAQKTKTKSVIPEIKLDEYQQQIVDFDPSGHLLVRGQAGSGKTTVLAARAGRVISIYETGRILFLTYNTALSDYVRRSFRKSGITAKEIKVINFHQWSSEVAKAVGRSNNKWIDGSTRESKLKEIINGLVKDGSSYRLYDTADDKLMQWWEDEIAWIFGQGIQQYHEYANYARTGRGSSVRITASDRPFIWDVFHQYDDWLESNDFEDYDNPGGLIQRSLENADIEFPENLKFDHVFVDEVQDFDRSWLLQVVKAANSSLSLAGDLHQKIYKRNFSWRSVGIKIQGNRSRKLDNSFRTTKKIMEVALQVMEPAKLSEHEDYTRPNLPLRDGVPVSIIRGDSASKSFSTGYDFIAKNFGRLRSKSVAVAVPFNKQTFQALKELTKRKVNAEIAKGSTLGKFEGGVAITTYHQLKGLEFDHVVLMGLGDDMLPGAFLEKTDPDDIDFEINSFRSLLYVGKTRAKETVTLVCHEPITRLLKPVDMRLLNEL